MATLPAALSFTIGVLIILLAVYGLQQRSRIQNRWIKLDNALVVESKVESVGRRRFHVLIYEYHSGDRHYLGESTTGTGPLSSLMSLETLASQYQAGDVISVYVNPDNHQVSLLAPTPPAWLCLMGICLGAVCMSTVLLLYGPAS